MIDVTYNETHIYIYINIKNIDFTYMLILEFYFILNLGKLH